MRFLIAVLTIFALVAAAQAVPNQGGRGLGFNCNVHTRKCTCEGIWEGADCQAMKKNCDLSKPTACTIYPPHECSCTMVKVSRRPPGQKLQPTTRQPTISPAPAPRP